MPFELEIRKACCEVYLADPGHYFGGHLAPPNFPEEMQTASSFDSPQRRDFSQLIFVTKAVGGSCRNFRMASAIVQ
jgi:hypothetical protein